MTPDPDPTPVPALSAEEALEAVERVVSGVNFRATATLDAGDVEAALAALPALRAAVRERDEARRCSAGLAEEANDAEDALHADFRTDVEHGTAECIEAMGREIDFQRGKVRSLRTEVERLREALDEGYELAERQADSAEEMVGEALKWRDKLDELRAALSSPAGEPRDECSCRVIRLQPGEEHHPSCRAARWSTNEAMGNRAGEPEIAAHIALAVNLHREALELIEAFVEIEDRDEGMIGPDGKDLDYLGTLAAARSLLARAREEGE